MPDIFLQIVVFMYGLCIGSFLNVCIFRIPESASLVKPGSSCPNCKTPIRFYDNIPVLSFIILLGKCRKCRFPISFRYPAIEILTGLFWLFTYIRFGFTFECLVYLLFFSTLIVITFIDIDHQIIPDIISLPGIPVCFLLSFLIPQISWQTSVSGILLGGGSLYSVALSYRLITGNDGMGGGDIKLLAMIGALIGWKGVFFTIFAASALGTIVGLTLMISTRNTLKLKIPFGPFLSAGSVIYIFFGTLIIDWYFGLSGIGS